MSELQMISKLSESEQQPPTTLTSIHVKTPKRILHFSDGILEEYSSDDEIDGQHDKNKQSDEKHVGSTGLINQVWHGGNKVLAACDYVGEKIAAALGITTPKYNYEIEQFKRIQKEREKAKEEEKSTGGWMQETLSAHFQLSEKEHYNEPQPIISQQIQQKF